MRRPRVRASFRFWQTELFIVVIVVAILILSGTLSAGLKLTLAQMGEIGELRNASALALRLEPDFPITVEGLDRMRDNVREFRRVYSSSIWVYDKSGMLLISSAPEGGPGVSQLEAARIAGLADNPPYADMQLKPGGWVVAAKVIHGPKGTREGVVVTASSVSGSLAILDAVRKRLWVTFWISLVVASTIGFAFSEVISRRVRAMSSAAAAIAAGDFGQRLPTGFAPDEIHDLAVSYNLMAAQLGEAFSALQERERDITAVVQSMAEGVASFSSAGELRVVNPEASRLLGVPARSRAEVAETPDEVDPAVRAVVAESLEGRGASSVVTLGEATVLLHSAPLIGENEKVDGAVLLLTDVTEQHRIEEAQRRFVADASHEMRTPIAALKGILELLNDGAKDDPEVRDDFMRTMQLEVDRLGRLVSDLLTLAQLEAGSLQPHIAAVPVTELTEGVTSVMRTLAEQAEVELLVEPEHGELEVLADRDRIVQVLLGFVDNALKHSPMGSAIHLRTSREGDMLRFEVADEGLGIEPERLAHVFDRFYQADDSRTGSRGTGLGLAIAKEIVEAHGSDIDVASAPDEGTTFSFRLPLA
jgi:signal transduction histidine kinase